MKRTRRRESKTRPGSPAAMARDLRRGDLTLRQLAGFTDPELAAMERAADRLRRAGDLEGAAAICAALLTLDPHAPGPWRQAARMHHSAGNHVEAVGCYEVLAVLQPRAAEDTRNEARCVAALGYGDLAREVLDEAGQLLPATTKGGADANP